MSFSSWSDRIRMHRKGAKREQRRAALKTIRARRVFVEQLEDRRLLAVTAAFDFSDDAGVATADGFSSGGPADQWHLSTGRGLDPGHSPDNSFYFGNGETVAGGGSYQANADGTLTSPSIDLRGATSARLRFDYFLDTEPQFDLARVNVVSGGVTTTIATSGSELLNSTNGFQPVDLDLSSFVGAQVNLQFRFTADSNVNREGWYVDDVTIDTLIDGNWQPQGPFGATNGQVENLAPADYVVGAVHTVLAHPTDPNVMYVGSVNGGVWKTNNATASVPTWSPLTDHLPSLSIGALAFDFADPTFQTIYAGTGRQSSFGQLGNDLVGLYKSTNGGQTWQVLSDRIQGSNISGIVANGANVVVSANTADSFAVSSADYSGVGIFRSTDGGATFTQISGGVGTGLPNGVAYDLVSDPFNPNTLYTSAVFADLVGGFNGVYRSTNGGASWSRVSSPAMNALILSGGGGTSATTNLELATGGFGVVYAAIINNGNTPPDDRLVGLFRSTNNGLSWTQMDTPVTNEGGVDFGVSPGAGKGPQPGSNPTPAQLAGGQGNIHFSIVADPNDINIVYVAGDRQPGPGPEMVPFPNSIGATDFSGRIFRGDASQPLGSQFVHLTHSSSLGAAGGGTANSSAPHADSREMTFDANGNLIETNDGGLYRRTNPRDNTGDWFSISGNLQITETHDVAYDSLSNTITSGNQDTGTTYQPSAGAQTWVSLSTADGGDVAIDNISLAGVNQSIRYTSNQFLAGFTKSTWDASGTLISQVNPALVGFDTDNDGAFRTPVEINAIDPRRLLIQGNNQVFESLDQGDSVTSLNAAPVTDLVQNALSYGGRKNGADNPGVIWAGSDNDVYLRTTLGAPLTITPVQPTTDLVVDLTIDPDDWASAFVIDTDDVFATADEGLSWSTITGNLSSMASRFLSISYVASAALDALVVGTNRGVFASLAGSFGTWVQLGSDLPTVLTYDMDYDATDDILVAGTMGRGVWTLPNVTELLNPVPAVTTVDLSATGDLVITDANGNFSDDLTIASDTTNARFVITGARQTITSSLPGQSGSGTNLVTIPFATVTGPNILVNTLGGNDTLRVSLDSGNFAKQINYKGGDPANDLQNSLHIIGSTALPNAIYNFAGVGSGTISISNNAQITYSELEPITSTVRTNTTTLNYTDAAGTLTVSPSGIGLQDIRVGSAPAESISFPRPTDALTINGGTAGNDVNIVGAVEMGTANVSISGREIRLESAALTTGGSGAIVLNATRNVFLNDNSHLVTVEGNIAVNANQAVLPVVGDFTGIDLVSSRVTTVNGDILLAGRGGNEVGGTFNDGVRLSQFSSVVSIGNGSNAGNITIAGRGGDGDDNNSGISISETGTSIRSVDGDISITGAGGNGIGFSNSGILMSGGTIESGGDGNIALAGIGSIDSRDVSVVLPNVSFLGSTIGSGNLTITADTLDMDDITAIQGTGELTIRPRTPATTIGVGGGVGLLDINDIELSKIVDGFQRITLGDVNAGTGDVLIDTATFADNIRIVGANIDINVIDAATNSAEVIARNSGAITNAMPTGIDITGGTVTLDGQVRPGATVVDSPGIVQVVGDLQIADNSAYVVEIGGLTPGITATDHDQVDVVGSVAIGSNVTLTPLNVPGYLPTVGDSIVIINNDGTDAVTGTFSGLAEQSLISNFFGSVYAALVTYAGGDGNDVVLSVVPNVRLAVDLAQISETGGRATFTATLSDVYTSDVTVGLGLSGQATPLLDYTVNPATITITAGQLSGSTSVRAVFDSAIESNETIIVDIVSVTNGREVATQRATTTILDDDFLIPVITTTSPSPTNSSSIPVVVDFGGPVTGFTAADLQLAGGTASNFVDQGNGQFTFDLAVPVDRTVNVNINAAAANDAAGKLTLAAAQLSVTVDRLRPTPVIIGPSSPTSSDPFFATVNFGEVVTGFSLGDLVVSGGFATGLINNGNGVFTVTVDAIGDGSVTMGVVDSAATDLANNASIAAIDIAVDIDTTGPTPTITGPASPTKLTPFDVVIDFAEAPLGFVISDIAVAGGVVSRLVDAGGGRFIATITAASDGVVTVNVGAATATDTLGNDSFAATPYSVTIDTLRPTPVLSGPASPTSTDPFDVIINFGEDVNGFTPTDLVVDNGVVTAFSISGNGRYTARIDAIADGTVNIAVPTGAASDMATNSSLAAIPLAISVDTTPPTPILSGPTNTTGASLVAVAIDFREAVTGFVISDIVVTRGTVANLIDNGNGSFIASVIATGDGPVSVGVNANVAADLAGNVNLSGSPFTVTVDTTPPTVTPPASIIVEADTILGALRSSSSITSFLAGVSAADAIDSSVLITNNAPAIFPIGDTLVVFTATDDVGNAATGSAFVTVQDSTSPVLAPPQSVVIEADSVGGTTGTNAGIVAYLNAASVTDIADINPIISHNAPLFFSLGDTLVTFTATDLFGNSVQQSSTVTVVDSVQPMVLAPLGVTVEGDTSGGVSSSRTDFVTLLASATASDVVDPNPSISHNAPAVFPVGNTLVTFSVSDLSGNVATATTTITVVDTTAPTITAPTDITVQAVSGAGTNATQPAIATFLSRAVAADIVDSNVTITHDAPAVFPRGVTLVTFRATDDSGNFTTGSASVNVVDTTGPVVTAPASIVVQANSTGGAMASTPAIVAFLSQATAIDAVDTVPSVINNAPSFFPLGNSVITFTATDADGNVGTATASVRVQDTLPPTISAPASLSVEADMVGGILGNSPAILGLRASVFANDIADASLAISNNAPAFLTLGDTTIRFTATDDLGNSAFVDVVVSIEDTVGPTITPPADITVEADQEGGSSATQTLIAAFLTAAQASDIVDASPSITHNAPAIFPVGNTPVTFTATDASGNTTTASAIVTVLDTGLPTLNVPAPIIIEGNVFGGTTADNPAIIAFVSGGTATDLVDGDLTVTTDALDPFFPLGDTLVIFHARDAAGNETVLTRTITVVDTTPPNLSATLNLTLPADTPVGASASLPAIVQFLNRVTATDIVEEFPVVENDAPSVFPIGTTRVLFTASDASGNQRVTSALVTVTATSSFDFGDAPTAAMSGFAASYPVTLAQNGARHVVGSLFLGQGVDGDNDGQPDVTAGIASFGGDDNVGTDDEDGVTALATLVADGDTGTSSSLRVVASQLGKLDAWIDFNRDGDWEDAGEKIFDSINVVAGDNFLSVNVPAGTSSGLTAARFRVSTLGSLSSTGAAADGEVEDYVFQIENSNVLTPVLVDVIEGAIVVALTDGDDIVVTSGSLEIFRGPASGIRSLVARGGAANDSVTLDFASGLEIPGGGVNLQGGAGANVLTVLGDAGTIDLTNPSINVTNFERFVLPQGSNARIIVDRASIARLSPTLRAGVLQGGPGSSIVVSDAADWRMTAPVIENGNLLFTARNVLGGGETIRTGMSTPFYNFLQPGDVDNNGDITSADALAIVFELNERQFSDPDTSVLRNIDPLTEFDGFYLDRNRDGLVTALDALLVINDIFEREFGTGLANVLGGNGEGEVIATDVFNTAFNDLHSEKDSVGSTLLGVDSDIAITPKIASMNGAATAPTSQSVTSAERAVTDRAVDDLLSDESFLETLKL